MEKKQKTNEHKLCKSHKIIPRSLSAHVPSAAGLQWSFSRR
uniref:Uncharacterized protein n=1 Tax=Anguilla anguilla TaxID=7936 RepID=A0A0E9RYF1_ANGAN